MANPIWKTASSGVNALLERCDSIGDRYVLEFTPPPTITKTLHLSCDARAMIIVAIAPDDTPSRVTELIKSIAYDFQRSDVK